MKKWYLIKTKCRQEKIAKQNLENQGYEIFCPIAKTLTGVALVTKYTKSI